MKHLLLIFCFIYSVTGNATTKNPRKEFSRVVAGLSLGQSTLKLNAGDYTDPGLTFSVGYYALPKLSLNASYFLTASPTGSSNMNGFGMSTKYYFLNTETSYILEDLNRKIKSFDRYFSYGGFHFIDRDVRTSKVTISYSGFGASLGAGYKLNYHEAIGIDLLGALLKSPTGSVTKDAPFSNFSIFYNYLF